MLSLVFIAFAHTLALAPPTMLGSCQGVSAPQDLQLHSFPLPDIHLYSPLQAQGVSSNSTPWLFRSPPSPQPLPPAQLHFLRRVEDWRPQVPSPRGLALLPSLQEDRGGGGGSHRALVGPLPSMHQVVLLQVGKLGEALLAQGALERAFPAVHTQMDLSQVWEKCCQPPRRPIRARDPLQISTLTPAGPVCGIKAFRSPCLCITSLKANLPFPRLPSRFLLPCWREDGDGQGQQAK